MLLPLDWTVPAHALILASMVRLDSAHCPSARAPASVQEPGSHHSCNERGCSQQGSDGTTRMGSGPGTPEHWLWHDVECSVVAPAAAEVPNSRLKEAALCSMEAVLGRQLLQHVLDLTASGPASAAGPAEQQQAWSAALLDVGPGGGRQAPELQAAGMQQRCLQPVKPYARRCRMMTVGIKVHTHEHDPSSAAFQRISQALIGAVNAAAGSLVSPGTAAERSARVHATCVQGCVQLLAGVCVPNRHASAGNLAGSDQSSSTLSVELQKLVGSRLQALYPGQQGPEFEVSVGSGLQGAAQATAGERHACQTAATGSSPGAPTGTAVSARASTGTKAAAACELLCCSPPCLAAGGGSTELQLMLDVRASAAGAAGQQLNSRRGMAARVVVWGAAGAVALDAAHHVTHGSNVIRLPIAPPSQPCLLHLALLLGDHSVAFVQPLLVLPAPAAAEMQQLSALAASQAAAASSSATAAQAPAGQQPSTLELSQTPPSPGTAEAATAAAAAAAHAWRAVIGPLLADMAYAISSSSRRPPPAAAQAASCAATAAAPADAATFVATAATEATSRSPKSASAVAEDEAGAFDKQLLVHLLARLCQEGMWATTAFVCDAAAACKTMADNSCSSKEQWQHDQQHQQQQQHQSPPPPQQQQQQQPPQQMAGALMALLLLPLLLLRTLMGCLKKRLSPSFDTPAAQAPAAAASSAALTAHAVKGNRSRQQTALSQLNMLLFGFQGEPRLEQQYLAYKYQHMLYMDAAAAAYHSLLVISSAASFPLATWQLPATHIGMAGFLLGWGLPAVLLWGFRRHLSPRAREVGVLLVDVALGLQAIGIALGWLAVPPGIKARLMPQSPLADDMIIVVGTGVMRSVLSQARVKWFAFSFAFYITWTACASISFGTPAAFAVRRFAPVVVLAVAISAALELHSRKAFLRLLAALDKGAPAAEFGASQAASSSKKQL